jgi:plasmid maintenance system antidote protein VapI
MRLRKLNQEERDRVTLTYLKYPEINQAMLADIFGVSISTISRIVREEVSATMPLYPLARVPIRGYTNQFSLNFT